MMKASVRPSQSLLQGRLCRRGVLSLSAALTYEAVITRILRHLKLAAISPPMAPARTRQATFDWVVYDTPQRGVAAGGRRRGHRGTLARGRHTPGHLFAIRCFSSL